jgi:hypothetical protein
MATHEAQALARIETLMTFWVEEGRIDDGTLNLRTLVAIANELGL